MPRRPSRCRRTVDNERRRYTRKGSDQRYKEFKNDERLLKAQHMALRWRELNAEMESKGQAIQEQQTRLEQVIAEQRSVEADIEKHREQRTESNESLNVVQGRYYKLGSDISRLEQSIQHLANRHCWSPR